MCEVCIIARLIMDFSVLWLNRKNPMGKRKIVSVKLNQRCWEASVKQSDPEQPGGFCLSCLTLLTLLCCCLKWSTPLAGKELTNSPLGNGKTKISQNLKMGF